MEIEQVVYHLSAPRPEYRMLRGLVKSAAESFDWTAWADGRRDLQEEGDILQSLLDGFNLKNPVLDEPDEPEDATQA